MPNAPSILLVEDSPSDARMFSEAVRENRRSCQLFWATSGERALELLQQSFSGSPPALIVIDLNLPGISGHELLAQLRSSGWERGNLVVFSTSSAESDRQLALESGASQYFTKPHRIAEFFAVVGQMLNGL